MRHFSPRRPLLFPIILGILAIGCDGLPTSPVEENSPVTLVSGPAFAQVGEATYGVLQWQEPLMADLSTSMKIGKKGGTLRIEEAGVTFVVPKKAIKKAKKVPGAPKPPKGDPTLTMTVHAGGGVAVTFGPHGTEFSKPAYLIIDLSRTEAAANPTLLEGLVAVYFEGDPGHTVNGLEQHAVRVINGSAVVPIYHFSGYLLADG